MSCICEKNLEYLKSAYPTNVIVVDWYWYTQHKYYIWVVDQIPKASKKVTEMINFLNSQGLDCSRLALIGHSLGAHMFGIASYKAACEVARLVALDPAGPRFNDVNEPTKAMSKESAVLVEVVHTNANGLGIIKPRGHLDFFVNGGTTQPGCRDPNLFDFKEWLTHQIGKIVTSRDASKCAHSRAYEYYAESINSEKGFYGLKCPDTNYFRNINCNGPVEEMSGPNLGSHILGTFYVPTNQNRPFALGIQPDKNFEIVKDDQMQFYLYCGTSFGGQVFDVEDSCFNTSWITVFLVHGWNTTYDRSFQSIIDSKQKLSSIIEFSSEIF